MGLFYLSWVRALCQRVRDGPRAPAEGTRLGVVDPHAPLRIQEVNTSPKSLSRKSRPRLSGPRRADAQDPDAHICGFTAAVGTCALCPSDQTRAAGRRGERQLVPCPSGQGRPGSVPHGQQRAEAGSHRTGFTRVFPGQERLEKHPGCRFRIPWVPSVSSVRTEIFLRPSARLEFPGCPQPTGEV